jgi:NADH-quinone oxidoreductase subunit L
MFRAYFLTFEGERRSLRDHHPHESPLMNVPLAILATLSIVAAVWGFPGVIEPNGNHETLWQEYLNPVFGFAQETIAKRSGEEIEGYPIGAWVIALVVAWAGAGYAYLKYMAKPIAATDLAAERPLGSPVVELVRHKFYVDEIYDAAIVQPVKWVAYNLWKFVDQFLIDTVVVRGAAFVASLFADAFRALQNGRVQSYAAVMAVSLAVLLFSSPLHHFFSSVFSWFGR